MNCPECRKKLWYWAAFSKPNEGWLSYICQHCEMMFTFEKTRLPESLPSWRGVRVWRVELKKRGIPYPPLTQRHPAKEAPSLNTKEQAPPSKRGVSK